MKSKHSGGGSQNYTPRNYSYQPSSDNGRQYRGGEPHFHMSGAPGPGQVMRNMHHQQPPQPTTPPNLQDLKAPATHMQAPPSHQMPQHMQQQQQQGPQQIFLPMNRQGGPPSQFQRGGPAGSNRPQRPNLMQGQSYGPGQHGQQIPYQSMAGLAQPTVSVMNFALPQNAGNRFYVQGYPNGAYQYLPVYPQTHVVRPPIPSSQIIMQQQQQQVQPVQMAPPIEPPPARTAKIRTNAVKIINPEDGSDVIEKLFSELSSTPPGSGQSSARETPQLPTVNHDIANEFARKVASSLGDEAVIRPGSRNSVNSETDPQANNELSQPNAANEAVPVAKLEPNPEPVVMTAVDPNETPPVENSMEYAPPRDVPRWGPMIAIPQMEAGDPMCVPAAIQPHLMVIAGGRDEMMNPALHQPRGYQPWQQEPPSISTGPGMAPGMVPAMGMLNRVAPVHVPPPSVKKPEQGTPVVSALAQGPTVDISREYPALGGQRHGAHHQSPARKRRPNRPEVEPPTESAAPPSVPAPVSAPPTAVAPAVPVPEPALEVKTEVHVPNISAQTEILRHSSPHPVPPMVEETIQRSELPAPEPTPTPTLPVEAKPNHQKSKSNKRQQRHEQQRQATPPPRPVTPAATAVVQSAVVETVEAVKPAPVIAPERASSPVPVQVSAPQAQPPRREPSPAPAPKVSQVVDDKALKLSNMKLQDSAPESLVNEEERKVAAMNEENEKLTASNKLANANNADSNTLDNKVKNNVPENNNVPNVTVVVEPATTAPEPNPVIENPKPLVLKHPYKDDQWSPLNRDGKKQYGREFLIALQNEPQSKKRPENLPELEVLRDLRAGGGSMRGPLPSQRSDSGPYMNKSSSLRGSSGGGRDSGHLKRASLLGKQKSQKPMPIQVSISLNEEVKLREADAPWKPSRNVDQTDLTEEDKKTEMLYKKVRGVLNRLTPQNFHKLVAQVRALPIDTIARLEGVIDLVFVKAVDEPGFSVTYADLCSELSKLSVASSNFRVLLIFRCQREFEKNPDLELNRDDRMKEIEAETDPEKKKELIVQLEEDERRIRVKSVGNIRFIGELYKLRMLNTNIMFVCVDNLLKLNTEESLECLCKLLTTIGKNLEDEIAAHRENLREAERKNDQESAKKYQAMANADLNKYFNDLDRLVKNKSKKISSRVRFMIQDLLDLRKQRWVPRREDSAPKTVDQIVKDAEREQLETSLAISAAGLDNRRMGGRQDSRNSMDNRNRRGGGGGGGGGQDGSGWTQVAASSGRKQYVETNKLRVNQLEMDLGDNMSLGSRNTFIWNPASKPNEREQPSFSMTQNKYAILEEKPHSRSSSLKGNLPSGADSRDNRDRPSRPSLYDDARSSRNSQQFKPSPMSRDVTPVVTAETPVAVEPVSTPAPPVLDSEAIERAAKTMVEQFVSDSDYKEATATLEEMFADSVKGEMVLSIFNTSLERSEANRRGASKLLSHFLKTGGISEAHLCEGLKGFMEQADDLIVDIPRLWDYFAELVADIVADGLSLSVILDILGPPNKNVLNSIAAILRLVAKLNSQSLAASVPVLRAYLGSATPYQSFIEDYKLEFLENAPPAPKIDEARVTAQLVEMMRKHEHFDKITEWIDKNFGDAAYGLPFIIALTNAFLELGLSRGKNDAWKLDTEAMKRYVNLMSRYVDNQADRELQCLFCIQAKMNKLEHPQGMLCEICTFLIDTGIHSAESFKSWKASNDPRGVEGHGVCMTSLVSFFTMIEEDDDDAPNS